MAKKPGPTPKRSAALRRRNTKKVTSITVYGNVPVPAAPKYLHPAARRWYLALRRSGQSEHFQPSDWAAALFVAEAISRNLGYWDEDLERWVDDRGHWSGPEGEEGRHWIQPRFSAVLFASVWSAMDDLLTTEAARLRAGVELNRKDDEEAPPPGVTAIAKYRKALEG